MKTNKQYCKPQAEVIDLLLGTLLQQASGEVNKKVIDDEDATESAWSRRKSYDDFDDEEDYDE